MGLDIWLTSPACPTCGRSDEVFQCYITHNMGKMAREAGISDVLWRPHENNITVASQWVAPLKSGIEMMRAEPERFKQFNPKNGWGNYDEFLSWLDDLLAACIAHPQAIIDISA
jgi:hypothetical protein